MNWKEMIFGPGADNANQTEESEGEASASTWREMVFGPGSGDTNVVPDDGEPKPSWREAIFGPGAASSDAGEDASKSDAESPASA